MNRSGFISLSIFILLLPLNLFGETDSVIGKGLLCFYNELYLNKNRQSKECRSEGLYFETEDTVKVMSIRKKAGDFYSPLPDENGYYRCASSSKEYGYQFTDTYKYEVSDYEIMINSVSEKEEINKWLRAVLKILGYKEEITEEKTFAVLNRETLSLKRVGSFYYRNCEAYNSKEELIKAGEDFFENFLNPRDIRIKKYYKTLQEERKKEEEERKKKRKI